MNFKDKKEKISFLKLWISKLLLLIKFAQNFTSHHSFELIEINFTIAVMVCLTDLNILNV